jgi:hypothetical protein
MIRQLKLAFFREGERGREREGKRGREGERERERGKLNLKNSAFLAIGVTLAICIINYSKADRKFIKF